MGFFQFFFFSWFRSVVKVTQHLAMFFCVLLCFMNTSWNNSFYARFYHCLSLPDNDPQYVEWDSSLVYVILTFKCRCRYVEATWCCCINLMRSSLSPRELWDRISLRFLPSLLNWPAAEKMMFCIADHLENGRGMRNGIEAERKNRSGACKTLTVVSQKVHFFSVSYPRLNSDTSSVVLTRLYVP